MNTKELFYIFLKYSGTVISSFDKQSSKHDTIISRSPSTNRRNFFEVLHEYEARDKIFGRNPYSCYMEIDGWERYGIFSYVNLYKEAKWDLHIIEEYKNNIVWTLLLQFGDFIFEEDTLIKYEHYIPWYHKSLFYKFSGKEYKPYLHNFNNVGKLSETFIKSNISRLYIPGLCSSGDFELNEEIVELLQNNWSLENYPHLCYESIVHDLVRNERISITLDLVLRIANNVNIPYWDAILERFTISQNNFHDLYRTYPEQTIKEVTKYKFKDRRAVFSIIEKDPNLRDAIDLDTQKNIWQGGKNYGYFGKFDNLPFVLDLTREVIINNVDLWNKQTHDIFVGMNRRPDTNYDHYERITAWDVLNFEDSFLLTYDICKCLSMVTVMSGGSYIMEDGHYHTDDIPDKPINGLVFFRFHDIANDEEFKKISNDEDLITLLLQNTETEIKIRMGHKFIGYQCGGGPIINRLISEFFSDFSYEKFVEINKLITT